MIVLATEASVRPMMLSAEKELSRDSFRKDNLMKFHNILLIYVVSVMIIMPGKTFTEFTAYGGFDKRMMAECVHR